MGGKTSTSTSQVQIPPEVLARYNSVNATAENVAQTPFQQYSTNPNAFVAPLTSTQQSGIENTNAAQGMAQPYYNAATGFALAGSQPITAQPLDTSQYMNPYLQTVLGSTAAQINQNNQQAMSGQTGNAMSQGYFGGDRSGIASAVLQGQQNLAAGQVYSGIASDAYNQALAAAQQQQGVQLGAAQANRAATQQTGETLTGLGTTAQGTALAGAQAQLGAGQVEQQTQQAGDTALYNQFLQQQSYPFQTAQFLANIAEGTGALSGSTTSTTQPQSIFSDERLKEDMAPIGKGFDGANIYRFRYKGDPTTRIGLSAQETEQKHPEAVREHAGFKAVDYGRATDDAARRGFALAANDDFDDDEPRRARQGGGGMPLSMQPGISGAANPYDLAMILQAQEQSYAPFSQAGLYGGQSSGGPYGGVAGHVPAANLPVGHLQVAAPPPAPRSDLASDLHSAASLASDAEGIKSDYHLGHEAVDWATHLGQKGGEVDTDNNPPGPPNAKGGQVGDDMRIPRQGGGGNWGGDPVTPGVLSPELRQQIAAAKIAAARRAAAQPRLVGRPAARATAGPGSSVPGQPGTTRQPGAFGANPTYQARQDPNPISQALSWVGGHLQDPSSPAFGPDRGPSAVLVSPGQLTARQQAQQSAAADADTNRIFSGGPAYTPQQHAHAATHHAQLAQAHAAAAGDPSLSMPAALPENIPGTRPGVVAMNAGDTSNLQTGFAPADLTPYHEGLLQRAGDWLGGHFGSDAQRMAYDARGMTPDNSVQPVQSRAFANAPSINDVVASASQREAPPPLQTEDALARSGGPTVTPINTDPTLDAPVTLAQGGFARANRDLGGTIQGLEQDLPQPTRAVAGGIGNLAHAIYGLSSGGRTHRQDGGDLSNPQNDNPYHPQGPGLNIPTANAQHPQLAVAKPPGQQDSGLSSALGDAADVAKIAALFMRRGGRAGYDDGGAVPDDPVVAPAVHDPNATPVAAAADDDTPPPAKQPGLGAAAQPPPSGQGGGFLPSLFHGVENLGKGVAGAAGYEGHGQWDIDKLMPLLSAIGTAGSVPTVHPLVALAAGLGGYGQAYMAQQQKEAQLNLTQAQARAENYGALPASVQRAVTPQPGPAIDPRTGQIDLRNSIPLGNGKYMHYGAAADVVAAAYGSPSGGAGGAPGGAPGGGGGPPQAGVQGAPGSAGAGVATGPVTADYSGSGTPHYTIGPSASEAQRAAASYGINPAGSRLENEGRSTANRPDDAHLQAAEKQADDLAGNASQVNIDQANFRDMINQATQLPDKGLGAVGPGQGERQLLQQIANTWGKMLDPNFEGLKGVDANSSASEILSKLTTMQSDAMAGNYGLHAASIAHQLQGVLPSGDIQKASTYNIVTQLMVAQQRARDFNEYRQGYQNFGIGDWGLQAAFDRDTGDIYNQERTALPKLMTRMPGANQSVFEYLQKNPAEIKRFEQGYDTTDANGNVVHVKGYGPGFGRVFQ